MTAVRAAWLQSVSGPAALSCGLLAAALSFSSASARTAPVRVLVGTAVSDVARASMPPTLWAKLVADYVSASTIPFAGTPTLADCRRANADFMVDAPFDFRPRLPGMPNSTGRVAAMTHLVVTNCLTENVVQDLVINFDSDPSSQSEGDFESSPQITWSRNVPAALARHPVFFPRVVRVIRVNPPFATIDGYEGAKAGDVMRIFADANHRKKGPLDVTVTQVSGKTVDVFFSAQPGGAAPAVGDYLEPAPVGKSAS